MKTETSNETIRLPDAPPVEGLRFRRFRGESDYAAMARVISAANSADGIEEVTLVDDIRRNYAHLSNSDPFQDMLFAEVGETVIGYNRVTWWQESTQDRIYFHFGFLAPEWRQRGIGQAMLRHSEWRLRQIAADHPANGPRFYAASANEKQGHLETLLNEHGYRPVRHFYEMVRPDMADIPDLPLPDGLEVRPVEPEQYRAVWEANVEAFRDHWGFAQPDENDYHGWLKDRNFSPELWQVAWDGDQVAGMVLNYIDEQENAEYGRRRGYTEDICVRRPWRRRGLARVLIARSLRMLKERGMDEAALGVDTENLSGALRLYESAGFRAVERASAYRRPMG